MTEGLKTYLHGMMSGIEGLHAIAITDREGVLIVKVSNQLAPDTALKPGFLSLFGIMTEQASKMGMGNNRRILNFYDKYQTIQTYSDPLVLHYIADKDSNTGLIINLENEMDEVLAELGKVVTLT